MLNKEQITAAIALLLSALGLWSGLGASRPADPAPPVPDIEEPAQVDPRDFLGGGLRRLPTEFGFARAGRNPFRAADIFIEPTLQSMGSPPPAPALRWALPGGELASIALSTPAPVLSKGGLPTEIDESGVPEPEVPGEGVEAPGTGEDEGGF